MIEFRHLAYFVAACQQPTLARAAADLGVAQSTLSVALRVLEEEVGLPLFRRVNAGLAPSAAARWLYRTAVPLLHAESFARHAATAGDGSALAHVVVDIRLAFSVGRISKAVGRAIEGLHGAFPATFVEPRWHDSSTAAAPPLLANGVASWVTIDYVDEGTEGGTTLLADDPWVLARDLPAGTGDGPTVCELLAGPIVVPALPKNLVDRAAAFLSTHGATSVRFTRDDPGSLPRLTGEMPDTAFLVPRSLLASRLGLIRVRAVPVEPALVSRLRARVTGDHAAASAFIAALQAELAQPEGNVVFKPVLTLRRLRYFRLLHRNRNLTAAARVAKVAQPALTGQLRKMEESLGGRLFERRHDGLVPTTVGDRLNQACEVVEASLRQIEIHRADAVGKAGGRLRLGILPSVGQDGGLLGKVADAITRWRQLHSNIALQVLEAPNGILQDWVNAGTLALAVVETDLPQMARFNLNAFEALAVIADPRHGVVSTPTVTVRELVRLPLVLPTSLFGIRQLLDAAANAAGLELTPVLEVNSLPMLIALVRRAPLCTVLPPSAVPRELADDELVSHPLVEPAVGRRLYAIYSNDRSLTAAERDLVRLLREELRSPMA